MFGFIGILLFVGSLLFGIKLLNSEKKALSLDKEETIYGSIGEGPLRCSWEVKSPERVMGEDKSQAMLVELTNPMDTECESTVTLRSPGFDMSPNKEEQTIKLAVQGSGSFSWILTPRKAGVFELSVSDAFNTRIFGITVTNTFGLTAGQAKIFSFIGGLLGPMLTVPWWIEKWYFRKKKITQVENNEKESS